ncbi:hypothetical protein [Pseudomonas sp. CGJS7]|uniref:hypothetical protein n=1 Tax=Pseudomonas sp. CGJS7 TaxID=3109348 RepID=UPI0030084AB3
MTAARARPVAIEQAFAKRAWTRRAFAERVGSAGVFPNNHVPTRRALAQRALRASAMSACLVVLSGTCIAATASPFAQAAPTAQTAPAAQAASRPAHSASVEPKAGAGDWIGRVVPPYPDGYKSNTGGCVGSGRSAEQICARSIGTIDDAEDRSLKFYAGELVGRIGNEARWKITDVVPYPKLQRGERVSMSTCMIDGVNDPGVIAIVDTAVEGADAREMFDAVRWAVKLDRRKGRFITVKPTEVSCYNEGAEGE